ncbi:MAG TPA: hypothetical protein VGK81_08740 [Anaerolineae bacterium]|jgi:uncharacterized membrane protein
MILQVHSIFRWVVVIVGIVTLVKLILAIAQKSPFTRLDRILTMLFSTSVDIQILLGVITIFALGFSLARLEHAFVTILALVAVHLPMRWRKAPDAVRFRNTLICFVAALVLIFIGVAMVNGWVA